VIHFLSCEIAEARFDRLNEDGELFLAEFAQIFLHGKGGRAIGRNQPVHYKPGLGIFVGPRFLTDGTEVVAEVARGARYATLKGQYRLDAVRIRQQIATLKVFLGLVLLQLQASPRQRRDAGEQSPSLLDMMIATLLAPLTLPVESTRGILSRMLTKLDQAESDLRGLAANPFIPMHKACQAIEDALDVLDGIGIPTLRVLPVLVSMMQSQPVSPS
jgi:hypothetical protein